MIKLVQPQITDLKYRKKLLKDKKTMAFNKINGGTVDFNKKIWKSWYQLWMNDTKHYYAYVYDDEIKKYIGSYAAVMNGLDAVIFTGGIGENSWEVRGGVCTNMDYLGIKIDFELNKTIRGTQAKISTPDSKVEVWVIPTNEELLIARDTLAIISK